MLAKAAAITSKTDKSPRRVHLPNLIRALFDSSFKTGLEARISRHTAKSLRATTKPEMISSPTRQRSEPDRLTNHSVNRFSTSFNRLDTRSTLPGSGSDFRAQMFPTRTSFLVGS